MLCQVDLADVFTGRRSPRWALKFAEHCVAHPHSMTRALALGGDSWLEWFGWDQTAKRVLQNTNVTAASAGSKVTFDGPTKAQQASLDEVAARLMS